MKTIAIITFSFSNKNYGQILQAYALQHYLQQIGHNAYLIDYYPMGGLEHNNPSKGIKDEIKYMLKQLPILKQYIIKRGRRRYEQLYGNDVRNFEVFRRKYLKYSDLHYETLKELSRNPPKADIYITGSDQVWSRSVSNSAVYMLGFANPSKKKIAYAASFGRKQLEGYEKKDFQKYLSEYSAIGVREVSGVEICKSLQVGNACFTPDPTILLSSEGWRKLSEGHNPFRTSKKKIFVYSCYFKREDLIDKIKENNEYEVVIAEAEPAIGEEDITILSPQSWIAAIDNADYVVSNSFHATMFSLYMNTNFVTIKHSGQAAHMNTRLDSILSMLNLTDRFVEKSKVASVIDVLGKDIDWDVVNKRMQDLRKTGVDFLTSNIED